MKRLLTLCLCLGLNSFASAATLIHNINGYTLNEGRLQQFSGLEFEGEKITALYASEQDTAGSSAEQRVNGHGATLLPGLIDAHGHVGGYGKALATVQLEAARSEQDATERVARFSDSTQAGWVLGRGWNQVLWPGKQFPSRKSLDTISADRPIALIRVDGHALWVNSKALEMAGINASTPDPEGGQIIRDANGDPTGILVDNAMNAVKDAIPDDTEEQIASYLHAALTKLASFGLTGTHDARVDARSVRAYQSLASQNRLPIRVYGMLDVLDPDNDSYLERGTMVDASHMLDIRSVKISADGALGSRGAALFDAYSDSPGHKGLLLLSDKELEHHISRAMAAGYQVNTHAIGDLANARVLDFYEKLIDKYSAGDLRHRVEHAQVLRSQDVPRFVELDVIASIQPTHATSDKNMAGDRLGQRRLAGAYAWKTLLDSGAKLAGGSDFPVEHPNPFFGLYSAVSRQGQDGEPDGGWLPKQKLDRREALYLFTEGAAYAAHHESILGRLAPGYFADFILIEGDYFAMPESEIWRTRVLQTWVAGKRVYSHQ
jgi:predicted amidohydrolase YtcJ